MRVVYCLLICLCLSAEQFRPACGTPPPTLLPILKAIDQLDALGIDDACGLVGGAPSSNTGKRLESSAKNDFCAGPATPVVITTQTLLSLQVASNKIAGLPEKLKTDRSPLRDLVKVGGRNVGEGARVALVGHLIKANFSNVSKGELVNCKRTGRDNNDIHITFASKHDEDDICRTFTAEMSPHYRPEIWKDVVGLQVGKRPVRISGALFFDGSHSPCTATSRPNPKRASVWEIHPVYAFDVCQFTTKTKCRADDDAAWIPLHQWLGSEDEGDDDH